MTGCVILDPKHAILHKRWVGIETAESEIPAMSLDSAKATVRSLQHSLLLASSKGVSVLAGCGKLQFCQPTTIKVSLFMDFIRYLSLLDLCNAGCKLNVPNLPFDEQREQTQDVITDLSSHKNGQFFTPGFPSGSLLCPSKEI